MLRRSIVIVMTSGWLGAQLCSAAQPAPKAATAPTELTEEVLVRGTRLRELKEAITEAEERFYARYNDLNKVDAFDIECGMDAHTGTKIRQRRCFTKLQLDARAQNGLETLQMFQDQASGPAGQPGRPPNTDPDAVWLAHYDDYRITCCFC